MCVCYMCSSAQGGKKVLDALELPNVDARNKTWLFWKRVTLS